MIDNRLETFQKNTVVAFIQQTFWDRRRWSHLLENDPESDFKMVYYNSDGSQSTMWKRRKMFGGFRQEKDD
jgi:diaminopimelate epimerase